MRQDWIACPHRTVDQHFTLLASSIRSSFNIPGDTGVLLLPLTVLHRHAERRRIADALNARSRVFLFSSQKLGGEIDLPETDASPGAAVDTSVIEVLGVDRQRAPSEFGRHLFFEIQTADFHGSPLHAASLLRKACPRGRCGRDYHAKLRSRVEVCGTGVEGPNKANVFKRTIYQMIFKIELARDPQCAGFAIVLPVPVWDSWLRHLGQPQLPQAGPHGGRAVFPEPPATHRSREERAQATVYVFDIERGASETPNPLRVVRQVLVSADALAYHAFVLASEEALRRGVVSAFRASFLDRVAKAWRGQFRAGALRGAD